MATTNGDHTLTLTHSSMPRWCVVLIGTAHGHRKSARLVKEHRRNSDGWKEKYEYGTRSLVECVFGALKVKFGVTLRSRCDYLKTVETPLKVVICDAESANYFSCFNP